MINVRYLDTKKNEFVIFPITPIHPLLKEFGEEIYLYSGIYIWQEDIEGKEIFTGDVLELTYTSNCGLKMSDGTLIEVFNDGYLHIQVSTFAVVRYGFKVPDKVGINSLKPIVKVIDNIYQNPRTYDIIGTKKIVMI